MKTRKRAVGWRRRLWAIALAAVLVCALWSGTASAVQITDGSVPNEAVARPTVTIRGNVVVEKKKATGFYELALCVKTARTITLADGVTPVTEEDYLKDVTEHPENAGNYIVKNYPFQSAAATVQIDLDALTAVTWGAGQPVYSAWTPTAGTVGSYGAADGDYPRGIDLNSADNQEIAGLFTSLEPIIDAEQKDGNLSKVRVRLDTANPDEVTNATAYIEDYDPVRKTALLTLTANTSTTSNVIYNEETPVVVVRFAYDRERFQNTNVEEAGRDFWLGLDKGDATEGPKGGQAALTYLADRNLDKAGERPYLGSDTLAAESSVHQVVWYTQNLLDDQVGQKDTSFYYYLGAEDLAADAQQSVWIFDNNTMTKITPWAPLTQGIGVLAKRGTLPHPPAIAGDPDAAETYSFFQNLLRKKDGTLKLKLVNAETYRKPTGGGGTTILFYDWDDSLIGSLVVDKGDVRAEVEEYIEENLVHPELRPSQYLVNDKVPETTDPNWAKYADLTDSLAREHTYRGKYAYEVGKNDAVGPAGDTVNQGRADGEDYPLTNKLDYVFTKRVNSVAVEGQDTDGDGVVDAVEQSYVLPHKLTETELADAARYPYTYGWAVVEETAPKRAKDWKVMYDAAKLPDFWTTIGVGELSGVDPDYYDSGMAAAKTVPTPGAGAAMSYRAPQFLVDDNADWETAAKTGTYAYQLAADGAEGYLRFADFSNIDAELARYQKKNGTNKDTLIVKAVYEPGKDLLDRGSYEMIQRPYYNKLNDVSASGGAAYSVQVTLERQNSTQGQVQGVSRVRVPVIRQDNTIDQKWIESEFPEVSHDLINATIAEARSGEQSTYTKVDIDNGERIQFSLSVSARQNKVNYVLVEQYNNNFVTGGQRSEQNYNRLGLEFAIDNYNYQTEDSVIGDGYYDSDYETRNGSHGFVLYGTLNQFMQYATLNHTEGTDVTLIISDTNMMDANLRANLSGDEPSVLNQATMRQAILNAAIACEAHKGDPDFWNSELDCAELSYHQLQWYIIDGSLDTRATADGKKLDFCHLHEECAAAMSTVPDTWDEIITAARDNNTADLSKMTTTAIENLTYLRTDADGSAFDSANSFTAAIINAVTKLDALHAAETDYKPTWWELQYVILNGNPASVDDMRAEASGKYWWYDGSTAAPALPTAADEQWPYLLQAARDAYIPYSSTLKDGETSDWTTTTHLAPTKTVFDRNAATTAASHPAWRTLTGNLVLDHHEDPILDDESNPTGELNYTTDKFPSFEDFQTRLINAMKEKDPGGTGGNKSPTWRELQLAILRVDDPTDDAGAATGDEYWWYNGAKPFKITNLRTLMEAVRRIALDKAGDTSTYTEDEVKAAQDAWGKLTVADLEGTLTNTLRWSKTGQDAATVWPGQSEATWKTNIYNLLNAARIDMEAASATIDWPIVQYHIINKKVDSKSVIDQESYYYWWEKDGQGVEVDFTGLTSVETKLRRVMEATLRTEFGDPKAKGSVAAQATEGDLWELTHLVTAIVNETDPNANPDDHYVGPDTAAFARQSAYKAADLDDFLDMIADFRQAAQTDQSLGKYDIPLFSWYQIQYYVLENTYVPLGNAILFPLESAQTGYWWYNRDERDIPEPPPPPPEDEPSDDFVKILQDTIAAGGSSKIALTKDQFDAMQMTGSADGKSPTLTNANKIFNLMMADVKGSSYYNPSTGEVTLTWVQIQYYFATAYQANKLGKKPGVLTDPATALTGLEGLGFSQDKFPPGVKVASSRTLQSLPYVYAVLSTILPTTFRRITA